MHPLPPDTGTMVSMLSIRGVTKNYGNRRVLRGIDLEAEAGEIVALIGVNGAGKSTLASAVAGLIAADTGSVTIAGVSAFSSPAAARRHLGLAGQEVALYPTLTGRDNLNFFGRLAGIPSRCLRRRISELAESLDLNKFLGQRTEALSGGQRRRLHAAIAMLHDPSVLWLDEPTTGADVQSRQQLLCEIRRFADQGRAVVYATHYFPEVEFLGASVAVLHEGKIIARGNCDTIVRRHASPSVVLEFDGAIPDGLRCFHPVIASNGITRAVITVHDPGRDLAEIVGNLGEGAQRLRAVEMHQPRLESAFLKLTGSYQMADVENTLDAVAS